MFDMPGESYTGPLPAASERQQALRAELRRDVEQLSEAIGPRHVGEPAALREAEQCITASFEEAGFAVERQAYEAGGVTCANLIVEIAGDAAAEEVVVIGAHYDSVPGCPGANDNASGVAALRALARSARGLSPGRTLRFVAFVNEEPPFFQTPSMGSYEYAKHCHDRGEHIVAMISFDGLGYYTDAEGSQDYPLPFLSGLYPTRGDFISFVGSWSSRDLVHTVVGSFRERVAFPSQGAAIPGLAPEAGFSDHWAFWQFDYPGLMVTDTLPFRYPAYHTAADTADQLDYDAMARVVTGLEGVMHEVAAAGEG